MLLNVNVPAVNLEEITGVTITRQGSTSLYRCFLKSGLIRVVRLTTG